MFVFLSSKSQEVKPQKPQFAENLFLGQVTFAVKFKKREDFKRWGECKWK